MIGHRLIARRKHGCMIGDCTACMWHVEALGADESARFHIRRMFAMHAEEVAA